MTDWWQQAKFLPYYKAWKWAGNKPPSQTKQSWFCFRPTHSFLVCLFFFFIAPIVLKLFKNNSLLSLCAHCEHAFYSFHAVHQLGFESNGKSTFSYLWNKNDKKEKRERGKQTMWHVCVNMTVKCCLQRWHFFFKLPIFRNTFKNKYRFTQTVIEKFPCLQARPGATTHIHSLQAEEEELSSLTT